METERRQLVKEPFVKNTLQLLYSKITVQACNGNTYIFIDNQRNCKGCPALQSARRQQPPSGAHLRSSLCSTASFPALAAPAQLRVTASSSLARCLRSFHKRMGWPGREADLRWAGASPAMVLGLCAPFLSQGNPDSGFSP